MTTEDSKALLGAEQVGALLKDKQLPFHDQLTVEVGDSDYSQPIFLATNRKHAHLVSLVRCRGNRTFNRLEYRSACQRQLKIPITLRHVKTLP